jgi:WD40 repeat protein
MDLSRSDWAYLEERAGSFVGREWLFARVRSFLNGPPGTLLLRGDPGTGKTAVAARLAQASSGRIAANNLPVQSPVAVETISAAVFCRAGRGDVLELIQRLSEQLVKSVNGFAGLLFSALAPKYEISHISINTGDVNAGANVAGVNINGLSDERVFGASLAMPLRQLRERGATQQIVLMVDAVDEAASTGEINTFSQLLAKLDGIHLIVTCRPDAKVLFDFSAAEHRVDLVADAPPGHDDVRDYTRNHLRGLGSEDAMRVLGDRIADEADGNFLYAFHVTGDLITSGPYADMSEKAARAIPLPTGGLQGVYKEFLGRQIASSGLRWTADLRPVLAPLCVARGDGLTTTQLAAIASHLTSRAFSKTMTRDVTFVAGQFLDGPRPDGPFHTYHQSFARFLTDPHQNDQWPIDLTETNIAVLEALKDEGTDSSWPTSSPYARNHAPSHAAAAGLLERYVREADFLVGMVPAGMRSAVRGLSAGSRQDPVLIYNVALPFLGDEPGSNATVLALVSQIQGNPALSQELDEVRVERPYKAAGNIRPFDPALARFDSHTGAVTGVTALDWPGLNHQVVVTTSLDGTSRVWDPRDPGQELARFDGHADEVREAAALGWPGLNHQVVVTASSDGTALVWDPLDPGRELARFDRHRDGLRGVAVLDWPGLNHQVVVTASSDGTALVWDPLDPGRELARFDRHRDVVRGVAVLDWPGLNHQVIVTASYDGTALVWDPLDPDRELARFDGHDGSLWGVAVLGWPGLNHQVIVTTSFDWTARVWDPLTGRELARFDGHAGVVEGVAALGWPGLDHLVIVTTSYDGTARIWDPQHPGQELGNRFDGHTAEVWAAAAVRGGPDVDHQLMVTASGDTTARAWAPLDPRREQGHFDGHTGTVWRVAALAWPGLNHQAIVTASSDGTARVWDPRNPSRALARFDGPTEIAGVAALAWPGLNHQAIVTACSDGTARVWDPLDPRRELARFDGHTAEAWAVAALNWPKLDHQVIVTASGDKTARVWDPVAGRELACFDGHTDDVWSVAALEWPGLNHQVIITASSDKTARVWDPVAGRELACFEGHASEVAGIAVLGWPGLSHQVIVTASFDGTARVWDPIDSSRELACFDGHTDDVWSVAALKWPGLDHQVIATGSSDGTVRVWDPCHPHSELARLALLGQGLSIAVLDRKILAVATSRGFLVCELGAG